MRLYPSIYDVILCQFINLISVYSYWLMICYNFSLCYEIYSIVKNPLDTNYNKRANIYHILSQTIPIIIAILWIFLGGFYYVDRQNWEIIVDTFSFVGVFIKEVIIITGLILIIISIKSINTSSRYLYRYIVFCVAEFVNAPLYIAAAFISKEQISIVWVFSCCLFLFMTTWRILEVTVLNRCFNSLENNTVLERKLSYIPPNQSLFAANMISAV